MRLTWPRDISDIEGAKVTPYGRTAHLDFRTPDPYASLYAVVYTRSDIAVEDSRIVIADSSARAVTVTLPEASEQTLPVWVLCADATNGVTVTSKGGSLIGGASSASLSSAHTSIMLVPYEGAWYVAGRA